MKLITKIVLLLTFLLLLTSRGLSLNTSIFAETQEEKMERLAKEVEQYENEIKRLQSESNTLSNQIAQYDAQIRLTTLKIFETEEKILLLGGRINLIQTSMDSLTEAFNTRAKRTYKMARVGQPFMVLATATDLSEVISSFHYLRKIQEADQDLLERLDTTKIEYKEEKDEQEQLQIELERQKRALDSQKAVKANLLAVTKNDEKRYQSLLAAARAEFEAIQAIIAGKGDEVEVGSVSEGEKIASVIQGKSCNSSAAHLHFMIAEDGNTHNPFNYLKGGVSYENCSGSSCGSGDADSFNPSGSWNWPVNPSIRFTQGYGSTWAVAHTWVGRIYQFHNGIDINNKGDSSVKAVKTGKLFRGSYTGYNGCNLRYVRVDHDDGNLDTFYLHINY
jgi:peptidoglycan hydrolase CwlO-like protein